VRFCLIVGMALLASPSFVRASIATTGNEALALCQNEQSAACTFYYLGVSEGASFGAAVGSLKATGEADSASVLEFCAPTAATNRQMKDIAVEYLRRNPAKRHLLATLLAMFAWREAFPCQ